MAITQKARRGASALSYALLLGLIAIVGLAAISQIGQTTDTLFTTVGSKIGSADTSVDQPATPAEDTTPDSFVMATEGYAQAGQTVGSTIVQITGITSAPVSISGGSSAEYRICADAACSSVISPYGSNAGSVDAGQYIQLRQLAPATAGGTASASITVGDQTVAWDLVAGSSDLIFERAGGMIVRAYENVDYPFVSPADQTDQIQRYMVEGTCSRYGKVMAPLYQSGSNFTHISGPAMPNGRFALYCNSVGTRNGQPNVCMNSMDARDNSGVVTLGGSSAYNTSAGIFFFCIE